MPRFYQHLHEGQSKHEALRAVKQSFIQDEEYAAPFYWAGYTLNGDTGPINEKSEMPWWIVAVAGAFGVLFGFRRRIRRKRLQS